MIVPNNLPDSPPYFLEFCYNFYMKKFEYKILPVSIDKDKDEFTKEIDACGDEGWELIAVVRFSKGFVPRLVVQAAHTTGFTLFFKREKQD